MKRIHVRQRVVASLVAAVTTVGISTAGIAATAVPAHAASCRSYTYSMGGRSDCIKHIQVILNSTWYIWTGPRYRTPKLVVDGAFGPNTFEAVKMFQTENHQGGRPALVPDGIVGPKTWAELCYTGMQVAPNSARAAGCA